MHISSWATMTKRHHGRQCHCRTIRTFKLDYVSTPQATQWPDGGSKHIRQRLGCGNSIPRYVFPLSKTWWALIGTSNTSRDTKKDCGEPGCPNDQSSPVFAGSDEDRMTSANGTSRHSAAPPRSGGRYRAKADKKVSPKDPDSRVCASAP